MPRPPTHIANARIAYTPEELVFLKAIDDYRRSRGRPFPTWREVLAVVHSLGYRRVADPVDLPHAPVKES